MTSVPSLDYGRHLFRERTVRSVTANTRADGEEFLALAARLGITVTTTPYSLDDAPRALVDLAGDRISGAGVLLA
jgi:propanol-preferring alcohol dehydrogenase